MSSSSDSLSITSSDDSLSHLNHSALFEPSLSESIQISHPRESSLVFRCEARDTRLASDSRSKPSAYDRKVSQRFIQLNGLQDKKCWVTGGHLIQWAHMVPHAESKCSRLVLWLQLNRLLPIDVRERTKKKMSPLNFLPVSLGLHEHLYDNECRRALIRPTRADLHLLVQKLEGFLAGEAIRLAGQPESTSEWTVDWRRIMSMQWARQETIVKSTWNSYEYQIDFFDLECHSLINVRRSGDAVILKEAAGDRRYPNVLQDPLPPFLAPLCILTMTAYSVAQAWFLSERFQVRFEQDFVEDVDVMSYVVHLLGSSTPSAYLHMKRPASLPFDLPELQLRQESLPLRRWPRVIAAGSFGSAAQADFSSSPHRSRTELASGVLNLHIREPSSEDEAEDQSEEDDSKDPGSGDGDGGAEGREDTTRPRDGDGDGDSAPKRARLMGLNEEGDEEVSRRPDHQEETLASVEEEIRALEQRQNQLYTDLARRFATQLEHLHIGGHSDEGGHDAVDAVVFALVSEQGGPLSIDAPLRKIEERYDEILEVA